MTAAEKKKLLNVARVAAVGAGTILKDGFTRRVKVTLKGRIDPVTQYDLKAERFIVRTIRKQFPDHAFLKLTYFEYRRRIRSLTTWFNSINGALE